jgi:hypothetical protein
MTQGTACNIIDCAGSGMSHGTIANNKFQTWIGGSITSAITVYGAISCSIVNNWINNHSGTMDVGISCGAAAQMIIADNIISDDGGAGTITLGLALGTGAMNSAVGNRFVLVSGAGMSGGVDDRSFVDNRDALDGGNVTIVT